MRIILFTGKGGVGKTTAAAGTATVSALRGRRTLVLSTDAAHSLSDAFGVSVGSEPTEVDDNLFVQQVDAQRRFERSWADIQGYLLSVLDAAGVDPITAEELTVIPGAEEVLALLELRRHATSGEWDVVVVDCAPTAETLRLLALPEALGWYMDRVLPMERRVVKAFKPMLARAAGVPMPHDSVFDAVERLHRELEEIRTILTGEQASVRLVLTPESMVVAEARRSLTTLSLFGYRVDGVVANRVFPEAGSDAWRRQWVSAQGEVLREVEQSFAGLPVWRSAYRPCEPVGWPSSRRSPPRRTTGTTRSRRRRGRADDHPADTLRCPADHRTTVRGEDRHRPRETRRRAGGDRGLLPTRARPARGTREADGRGRPGRGRRAPGALPGAGGGVP